MILNFLAFLLYLRVVIYTHNVAANWYNHFFGSKHSIVIKHFFSYSSCGVANDCCFMKNNALRDFLSLFRFCCDIQEAIKGASQFLICSDYCLQTSISEMCFIRHFMMDFLFIYTHIIIGTVKNLA